MSSKKMRMITLVAIAIGSFFSFINDVFAEDIYNLDKTAEAVGLKQSDVPTATGSMLGIILSFIGVLFFALMVFGGFMWMTARGNEEQTKKALNTITAAAIGLIIVISAYTITKFLFTNVGL